MVIQFLPLVAPPVFVLLFLSGMAVTTSEVSLMHKSKLWLYCPRNSCMVSMGIHLLQFHTTYNHEGLWRLVCLPTKAWDSSFELKLSLSVSNSHLTQSKPLSSPQSETQTVSHSLHMVQCGHQSSEAEDLLAPGLNSAGCPQKAFSKTGGIMVPILFFNKEKRDKMKLHSYSCPLVWEHAQHSFWRHCYISNWQ